LVRSRGVTVLDFFGFGFGLDLGFGLGLGFLEEAGAEEDGKSSGAMVSRSLTLGTE